MFGPARRRPIGAGVIDNVGMSAAYDVEPWSDLMVAVVGAMAALAGLLFVALSINVDEIVRLRRLPGRAAATVAMLIILLLSGVVVLIPDQALWLVGAEIAALGLGVTIFSAFAMRPREDEDPSFNSFKFRILPLLIMMGPCTLLIVAGLSLAAEAGGGLYWLAAAFVTGTFATMTNAWVLLVEIKR